MNQIAIKLKEFDNKSRKGTYLAVKTKGKPIRYYKYGFQQTEIEAVMHYYNDKYVEEKPTKETYFAYKKSYEKNWFNELPNKTIRSKPIFNQVKKYLETIKKRGSLTQNLKKGVSSVITPNILYNKTEDITKLKKDLVEKLVINKNNLKLFLQDENFNKLRNRLDFEVFAQDNKGNTLLELFAHGKTLFQVKQELQKQFDQNIQVSKTKYRFLDNLKKQGWTGERKADGEITQIKVKINLRRG